MIKILFTNIYYFENIFFCRSFVAITRSYGSFNITKQDIYKYYERLVSLLVIAIKKLFFHNKKKHKFNYVLFLNMIIEYFIIFDNNCLI